MQLSSSLRIVSIAKRCSLFLGGGPIEAEFGGWAYVRAHAPSRDVSYERRFYRHSVRSDFSHVRCMSRPTFRARAVDTTAASYKRDPNTQVNSHGFTRRPEQAGI